MFTAILTSFRHQSIAALEIHSSIPRGQTGCEPGPIVRRSTINTRPFHARASFYHELHPYPVLCYCLRPLLTTYFRLQVCMGLRIISEHQNANSGRVLNRPFRPSLTSHDNGLLNAGPLRHHLASYRTYPSWTTTPPGHDSLRVTCHEAERVRNTLGIGKDRRSAFLRGFRTAIVC
jgi:hypothetical protein